MRCGALVCAVAAAALSACTLLPERPPLAEERALPPAESGPLNDFAARIDAALGPTETAHWLLDQNQLAMDARLALTDEAVSTLDVQYFIWQNDASGQLLASRLLAAADRGVKIRLLLDDFSVSSHRGRRHAARRASESRGARIQSVGDARLAVRHVRWSFSHVRESSTAGCTTRPTSPTAAFAMIGGRNIGDRYFGLYGPFVQNDLDVLLAGELVGDVTASFDRYWNSGHSYPVALFRRSREALQDIATTETQVAATHRGRGRAAPSVPLPTSRLGRASSRNLSGDVRAGPQQSCTSTRRISWSADQARLYPHFKALVASAQREVLISSPYFIPDVEFRRHPSDSRSRGRARRDPHEFARDQQPRRRAHGLQALAARGARLPASSSTSCAPMPKRCRSTSRRRRRRRFSGCTRKPSSSTASAHSSARRTSIRARWCSIPRSASSPIATEFVAAGRGADRARHVAGELVARNDGRRGLAHVGRAATRSVRASTGEGLSSARDRVLAEPAAAEESGVRAS